MLERAFLLGICTKKESLRDTHFEALTGMFRDANKIKEEEREQERLRALQAQHAAVIARAVARGSNVADAVAASTQRERSRSSRNRSRSGSRVRSGSRSRRKQASAASSSATRGVSQLRVVVPPPPNIGPDGQLINQHLALTASPAASGAKAGFPPAPPSTSSLSIPLTPGADGLPAPLVKRGRGRPRTVSLGSPIASTPGASSGLGALWSGGPTPVAKATPQLMQRSLSNAVIESLVEELPLDGEPSSWLRFCPPIFDGDFFAHEFARCYKVSVEKDRELTGRNDAVNARKCREFLRILMQNSVCSPFNHPVDPDALNIPEYRAMIQVPMDLGTVRQKLKSHQYKHMLELVQDVRLTFDNALLFNPPGHPVHEAAIDLARSFSMMLAAFVQERLKQPAPSQVGSAHNGQAVKVEEGSGVSTMAQRSPRNRSCAQVGTTMGNGSRSACTSPASSGGDSLPLGTDAGADKFEDGTEELPSVHECGIYHGPKRGYDDSDADSSDADGEVDDDDATVEPDEEDSSNEDDDGRDKEHRALPVKYIDPPQREVLNLPMSLREMDHYLCSYSLCGGGLSKRRSLSGTSLSEHADSASVDSGAAPPAKRSRTPRNRSDDGEASPRASGSKGNISPPVPAPVSSGGFFGFFRSAPRHVPADSASTHSTDNASTASGKEDGSEDWTEGQMGLDLTTDDVHNGAASPRALGGGGASHLVDPDPIVDGPLGATGARALLAELAMSLEKFKDDLFVVTLRDPEEDVDLEALADTLETAKAALETAKVPSSVVISNEGGEDEVDTKQRDPIVAASWFDGSDDMLLRSVGVARDTSDPDVCISCPIVNSRHVFLEMGMFKNAQFDTLRRAKASSLLLLYNLRHPHAEHMRPRCSECNAIIPKGHVRWHCESCPGYDLCGDCAEVERERPPEFLLLPGTPRSGAQPPPTHEKYKCQLYHDLTPFPVTFE